MQARSGGALPNLASSKCIVASFAMWRRGRFAGAKLGNAELDSALRRQVWLTLDKLEALITAAVAKAVLRAKVVKALTGKWRGRNVARSFRRFSNVMFSVALQQQNKRANLGPVGSAKNN